MQEVFNYYYDPRYPLVGLRDISEVKSFLTEQKLSGIELSTELPCCSKEWQDAVVGFHLPCWYNWLSFYKNDREQLREWFPDEASLKNYYGAAELGEWLELLRVKVKLALSYKPEYLVWHVTQVTPKEAFTFKFHYANTEILAATAELYKRVADCIHQDVMVLFENLWWSGLDLRNVEELKKFMELLKGYNVGVILDTGHLLNTSLIARTEAEGIAWLLEQIDKLGDGKQYIKGLHLNLSLSAEYRQGIEHIYPIGCTNEQLLGHVYNIDQHKAFQDKAIAELVAKVDPIYLNHELAYEGRTDLQRLLMQQRKACFK